MSKECNHINQFVNINVEYLDGTFSKDGGTVIECRKCKRQRFIGEKETWFETNDIRSYGKIQRTIC